MPAALIRARAVARPAAVRRYVADLEKRLTAGLVLPAEATPTEHLRLPERIERLLSVAPSILRPC